MRFLVIAIVLLLVAVASATLRTSNDGMVRPIRRRAANRVPRGDSSSSPSNGGAYGIDVSLMSCENGISLDSWKCLVNSGYSFAIIEAWNGGYQYNSNMQACISDAWNAGMAHVDVYVFMCPNCRGNSPASSAMSSIINNLNSQGIRFGQLWLDIEQCNGCWNDAASNVAYLREAANTAINMLGQGKVGMYSSKYEWEQTVGGDASFSNLPQWYAHYDGVPNFSDSWAYQFGGWNNPNIKQFNDHGPSCGVDVDVNWYPTSALSHNKTQTN